MKAVVALVITLLLLYDAADAHEYWATVDGTASPPVIIEGTIRPKITKEKSGYLLEFDTPISHILVTSYTTGIGGDSVSTFASVRKDKASNKKFYVGTYRFSGSGENIMVRGHEALFSFAVVLEPKKETSSGGVR